MDDEYDNLVGLFSSTSRHAASTVQHIFVWACEGVCVCVCALVEEKERINVSMCVCVCNCRKGHCSSQQYPAPFKGWILCSGVSDT